MEIYYFLVKFLNNYANIAESLRAFILFNTYIFSVTQNLLISI